VKHFYRSHAPRGNSSRNALRSVTQSVTGCISTLERGNDKILTEIAALDAESAKVLEGIRRLL